MLNPFDFLDHIGHCEFSNLRKNMARLALNIYFRVEASEFDVSEFLSMDPQSRVLCLAALSWAHTNTLPITSRPSYKISGEEILHDGVRLWLKDIVADRSVSKRCPF